MSSLRCCSIVDHDFTQPFKKNFLFKLDADSENVDYF